VFEGHGYPLVCYNYVSLDNNVVYVNIFKISKFEIKLKNCKYINYLEEKTCRICPTCPTTTMMIYRDVATCIVSLLHDLSFFVKCNWATWTNFHIAIAKCVRISNPYTNHQILHENSENSLSSEF
jgi:hypothetical protein